MSKKLLPLTLTLALAACSQSPHDTAPAPAPQSAITPEPAATKPATVATKPTPAPTANFAPIGPPATTKADLGNNLAIDLLLIKPGTFTMGTPASEPNRDADEDAHKVTLTKPFYIGKTEITQAQWKAVMNTDPASIKGDTLPVESVSWDQASQFCQTLSTKTGKKFRLPTEAEWEYAARAGTSDPYAGSPTAEDVAWTPTNAQITLHPVAQKKPNAWGLYDMLGNVWEWCSDHTGNYPTEAVTDPTGPATGAHINRGGSYADDTTNSCRTGNRGRSSSQGPKIGFRIVMETP